MQVVSLCAHSTIYAYLGACMLWHCLMRALGFWYRRNKWRVYNWYPLVQRSRHHTHTHTYPHTRTSHVFLLHFCVMLTHTRHALAVAVGQSVGFVIVLQQFVIIIMCGGIQCTCTLIAVCGIYVWHELLLLHLWYACYYERQFRLQYWILRRVSSVIHQLISNKKGAKNKPQLASSCSIHFTWVLCCMRRMRD